ncbi:unnamed protein product [Notodromas monacha]|uniref:All-trans-retinol 13,14-reductase n=1 Tax=Notodromas monacha TaxID=399045 RepID=A0A7R9GHM7_9CRUS|nr:unnamed protein product [Notodromas monacha]CAG0921646.1 unnamed protein product [Notodromas monacha]
MLFLLWILLVLPFSAWVVRKLSQVVRHPIFTRKNLTNNRPIVLDRRKRNEILANSFSPQKVEGQQFDAIIIGSGPSGMSTGSYLAKGGKKVLVLEQHDTAGGSCHTFLDKGYEFDAGHHYSPYMDPKIPTSVFIHAAVGGNIDFIQLMGYRKENQITTSEAFKSITERSPDMSVVLQFLTTDLTPGNLWSYPLWAFATAIMKGGSAYPKGGSSEYPFQMGCEIVERGGTVLVNANVEKIIMNSSNTKACGVIVKKGNKRTSIFAPIIVSSAGLAVTINDLLPSNIPKNSPWFEEMNKHLKFPGHSYFHAFVGLRGTVEELGLITHPLRSFATNEPMMERCEEMSFEEAMEAEIPMMMFLGCSGADPTSSLRNPGKCVVQLLMCASSKWFSQWEGGKPMHRDDEYEARKNAYGHKAIETMYRLYPQLEGRIDYLSFATEVTVHHYLNRKSGGYSKLALTPYKMSLEASLNLRPDTPIEGLFLTGEDTFIVAVITAILSGTITASRILNRNLILEGLVWHFYDKLRRRIFGDYSSQLPNKGEPHS